MGGGWGTQLNFFAMEIPNPIAGNCHIGNCSLLNSIPTRRIKADLPSNSMAGKLVGRNKKRALRRFFTCALAGQKIPDHKPPKVLMDKQIKHLGSSSPF